jgi:DNA-binding ferritin-like protein
MYSVQCAHKVHLKVTGPGSDAAHRAIGGYYDGLPDLIDKVAEQYQGAREKLLDIPHVNDNSPITKEYFMMELKELYEETNKLQKIMPFSEVVNQLDEIKSLIATTKYKLMFLS